MAENESKKNEMHMKPFGFLQKTMKSSQNPSVDLNKKTYVKADGTKVTEEKQEYGTSVTEVCTDGTVIARFYDNREVLRQDYIRQLNVELVHHYDEYGMMTDELTNIYDENNVLAKQIEKAYEYFDNGKKSLIETLESPSDIKTTIKFNEKEEQIEKFIQRGTMTTWYDVNDKPIKRQIDRGSGGIITEDLTK